jgi:protein-L-isoaspartate(D-aspartate) O-methyltransferase
VPGLAVAGVDVSAYALEHAKEEVRPALRLASATDLPFEGGEFDLVLSLNTLHNLECHDLDAAFAELQRVGRRHRYVAVESYRDEREKVNLLYWQLTCESFFRPAEWRWFAHRAGYRGDLGFIYFE